MKKDHVRLQKFLAEHGIASRREADRMILEGRVEVDGVVAEAGTTINAARAEVRVDGRRIQYKPEQQVVVAMNKPRGILCSHRDPLHPETVFNLLRPPHSDMRLVCVGRLDKESEGLLLMTNDGDLAQRLTHPSHQVIKRYRVVLDHQLDPKHIPGLLKGITWEGERLKAEKVVPLKTARSDPHGCVEVHLQHGKKREIRNLFYAFGYRVRRLRRTQIGGLIVKGLASGQYRVLKRREIERLFV